MITSGNLSWGILAFGSVINGLLAAFVGGFVAQAVGLAICHALVNSMLGMLHSEKLDDCMIPCWAGMLHMVKLQVCEVAWCR